MTYALKPSSGRGLYVSTRPKSLKIFHLEGKVFEVRWDELGKRRKTRDESGTWETLLRREVERLRDL